MIEKGTDTTRVQIASGRWEGAWGTVVSANEDGYLVQLDEGTEIRVRTVLMPDQEISSHVDLPRELGV